MCFFKVEQGNKPAIKHIDSVISHNFIAMCQTKIDLLMSHFDLSNGNIWNSWSRRYKVSSTRIVYVFRETWWTLVMWSDCLKARISCLENRIYFLRCVFLKWGLVAVFQAHHSIADFDLWYASPWPSIHLQIVMLFNTFFKVDTCICKSSSRLFSYSS